MANEGIFNYVCDDIDFKYAKEYTFLETTIDDIYSLFVGTFTLFLDILDQFDDGFLQFLKAAILSDGFIVSIYNDLALILSALLNFSKDTLYFLKLNLSKQDPLHTAMYITYIAIMTPMVALPFTACTLAFEGDMKLCSFGAI